MKNAIKAARNPTVNLGIHALMTFCMSTIIGTGFLIKYTLIPGQERWTVYGENIELYFLEMSRHQWEMLHLIFRFYSSNYVGSTPYSSLEYYHKCLQQNNQRTHNKKSAGIGFHTSMCTNDYHCIIYKT